MSERAGAIPRARTRRPQASAGYGNELLVSLIVESPAAGERAIALQLVVGGDQAELHLFGRRIVLGRVEPQPSSWKARAIARSSE